jgi:transposase InsO family protein
VSGYYAWRKQPVSLREQANNDLDKTIIMLFHKHTKRYGYRRIYKALVLDHGYTGSKERVRRRMIVHALKARQRKAYKVTTDSNHDLYISPNVLARNFSATQANQKWVGDITYIRTLHGWLYLATVIDLYSRKVVGWSMKTHMEASLVCDALKMALTNRGSPEGTLFHSDRGSQYCSNDFRSLISDSNFVQSMSRKGNCWDNAVAESFFKTLKTEAIYCLPLQSVEKTKNTVFEYIEIYYNRQRMHSSINYCNPVDYEEQGLVKKAA